MQMPRRFIGLRRPLDIFLGERHDDHDVVLHHDPHQLSKCLGFFDREYILDICDGEQFLRRFALVPGGLDQALCAAALLHLLAQRLIFFLGLVCVTFAQPLYPLLRFFSRQGDMWTDLFLGPDNP